MALYTMKELLADARKKGYGIGFFNTVNLEMVRACIRAAEEANSPIIIGTAEALLEYADFDWVAPLMLEQARNARVPVAVHLDHSYQVETILRALRAGFGSVMYDGSRSDHWDNVRVSGEIVRVAKPMGVGVECELGRVGGLSDETGREDSMVYTDPLEARDFIEATGADFLAVSIGTVHGVYKSEPRLDIGLLEKIREAVDVPLVLHGGSGLSEEDFKKTIAGGISKVNVFTDVILAARAALLESKDLSYIDMCRRAEEAMQDAVRAKLTLFGSAGRA